MTGVLVGILVLLLAVSVIVLTVFLHRAVNELVAIEQRITDLEAKHSHEVGEVQP